MLKESFVFMFISSFMALFPVANPVGTGFIINGFLSGLDRSERRSIVRRIAVNYLLIGIGSLAIGHFVLSLFGLSLPIVQLGGGLFIGQEVFDHGEDRFTGAGRIDDQQHEVSEEQTQHDAQAARRTSPSTRSAYATWNPGYFTRSPFRSASDPAAYPSFSP